MSEQSVPEWDLEAGLRELTALMLSTTDIEQSLRHIADTACRLLPGHPMAGVTLERGGQVMTVASSDAHASMIDEIQYSSGQGPCLECMRGAEPILVPDLTRETRWGTYSTTMLAHGVRSVYSHPLHADGTAIGALNLYATTVDGFDTQTRQAIQLTAEHTGVLLSAAINAARQAALTDQLRQALASRAVIDQALGMIMARDRCTAGKAFEILRTISSHRNLRLRDVAAEIVTAISGHPPALEDPHFA
ncbi:GAF and ANTAR domain-containing protein [Solihabitans fulvus]|uniref:GAF and ANTAR domain-containing protein n=1 Tax=Solihabitans fulvus TaxID=1892852 RepID=A0A5B2XG05_9PSEU|nr:GAF and ANTAR domain-containing protein [Solihabitans fulvus]KAA2261850.1 GAF and ANTAR domain-containing protein [Solihabitans fulvus]